MAILNTHATVKTFMKHGFSEEQAESIVEAINDQSNHLATKEDLINLEIRLESRISSLESKIESINVSINWLKTIAVLNLTIVATSVLGGVIALLLPKIF
ncbi:MAG TPA: hypothetical protein PLB74_02575 [Candidatus Paceibacterota bacterium]|nr:hypothetical protein [Candidatus Paceibacterota bacterium]